MPKERLRLSPFAINEKFEPSVLADFDAGNVLDVLSFGIIVLDKHLCAIYANLIAQEMLRLDLPSLRGRPLVHSLSRPTRFVHAARRALKSGTGVGCRVGAGMEPSPKCATPIRARITPLYSRMSGAYLLVELSARHLHVVGNRCYRE